MKKIYFINKGDSLNKISKICKCDNLKKSEDLLFGNLYVEINDDKCDDIIKVENYCPIYEYVCTQTDSSLDIMSRGFEIVGNNDCDINGKLLLKKPTNLRYVVRPTDSIFTISEKYGVSVDEIKYTNNLKSEKLFIGQVLWL